MTESAALQMQLDKNLELFEKYEREGSAIIANHYRKIIESINNEIEKLEE